MVTAALQAALDEHHNLRHVLERYPEQAAPLSQTIVDLTHASRWSHLSVVDICADRDADSKDRWGGAVIIGQRPESAGLEAVWCCSISDMLHSEIFQTIFNALDGSVLQAQVQKGTDLKLLPSHFLLAVYSPDATVVYYNMARGLVKPVN